jgi:hypothetical protein
MVEACVLYTQDSGIVTHLTNKIDTSRYRITVITPHFQCGDLGSIPGTCSEIYGVTCSKALARDLCKIFAVGSIPISSTKNKKRI